MFLTLFYNNADQNLKGKQFSRRYQTSNIFSRILTNMTLECCNDCGLLHEQWSDVESSNHSISSLQKDQVENELSRCPRCSLLHSFLCVSFGNLDIKNDDPCCSYVDLDKSVEWDNFLVQAHSTKKLDWVCNWDQFQKALQESSHSDSPRLQPATLVSYALQALEQSRKLKRVSFNLPEADTVLDTSCNSKQFALKEVLEHTLKSLSEMQTLALDVLFDTDQTDWLNNSLVSNFETAICSMNPLQSLAVAVRAGYVNMDRLPKFVDSSFIARNSQISRYRA